MAAFWQVGESCESPSQLHALSTCEPCAEERFDVGSRQRKAHGATDGAGLLLTRWLIIGRSREVLTRASYARH
jgi:hypothetical protein